MNQAKLSSRWCNQNRSEGPWSSALVRLPDVASASKPSTLIKVYADSSTSNAVSRAGQHRYRATVIIGFHSAIVSTKWYKTHPEHALGKKRCKEIFIHVPWTCGHHFWIVLLLQLTYYCGNLIGFKEGKKFTHFPWDSLNTKYYYYYYNISAEFLQ